MGGEKKLWLGSPLFFLFFCAHAPTFARYVVFDKDISVKTTNYSALKETLLKTKITYDETEQNLEMAYSLAHRDGRL